MDAAGIRRTVVFPFGTCGTELVTGYPDRLVVSYWRLGIRQRIDRGEITGGGTARKVAYENAERLYGLR